MVEPKNVPRRTLNKWKELGPLDLYKLIEDGMVEIDSTKTVKELQDIKYNDKINYSVFG